jgi:hypothetical protein
MNFREYLENGSLNEAKKGKKKQLWIKAQKSVGSDFEILFFDLDQTIKNDGERNAKKMDEIHKLGYIVYNWGIVGLDKVPPYFGVKNKNKSLQKYRLKL